MILHVIQCSQCKGYLASIPDKLSKNWERRRYFDTENISCADLYIDLDEVVKALEDGMYKGGLCPACQKDRSGHQDRLEG